MRRKDTQAMIGDGVRVELSADPAVLSGLKLLLVGKSNICKCSACSLNVPQISKPASGEEKTHPLEIPSL